MIRNRILYLAAAFFPLTASAITVNGPTTIYPIEAALRGADIYNLINTFVTNNGGSSVAEALIQTSISSWPGLPSSNLIVNGLIPYIRSIAPAPNYTLFIVTFANAITGGSTYVIVLPIEAIVEVILISQGNYGFISGQKGQSYGSAFPNGVIPFLSIHPTQRAADIAYVVANLPAYRGVTQQKYYTYVQTVVNGSNASLFYPATVSNGLFKYVTGAAQVNNAFVQISYTATASTNPSGTFTLPSEQVGLIYLNQ